MPRAAYALCLALCSAAPHASCLDSRYAQQRSDSAPWHRALCQCQVPRQWASIRGQQGDEHMLQQYVSCVSDVCYIRFYLDVAKLDLVLHMLQWLYTMLYVYCSNVSNVCCKCFILTLHMLHWLYTYVTSVCFKCFSCFKCVLQVFLSGCCICYSAHTICCKRML
jgi:hypothetical protein